MGGCSIGRKEHTWVGARTQWPTAPGRRAAGPHSSEPGLAGGAHLGGSMVGLAELEVPQPLLLDAVATHLKAA